MVKKVVKKLILLLILVVLGFVMYTMIYCFERNSLNQYGIIDITGKKVVDFKYNFINSVNAIKNEKFIWVNQTNGIDDYNYYYIDLNGKEYGKNNENNFLYENGRTMVLNEIDQVAYKDENGNLICDFIFDRGENFCNNMARVKSGDKYGFINTNGELIIDCIYDDAEEFETNGLTKVYIEDSGYGIINKKGQIILECKYDEIYWYNSNEVFFVSENNINKLIDLNGNMIFYMEDEDIIYNNNRYQSVGLKDFDYSYNSLIGLNLYANNLTSGKLNEKYGIIDYYGNQKSDFIYDDIYDIDANKSLIVAELNGKMGCAKFNGDIIIDFIYEDLSVYNDDIVIFEKDNKYGCMDLEGNIRINNTYDDLNRIGDKIVATINDKKGLIDLNGKEILPCNYDELIPVNDELVITTGINIKLACLYMLVTIICGVLCIIVIRKIFKKETKVKNKE